MQISEFIRDSETFSIGAAAGKGALSSPQRDRPIEYLEALVDGEWQVDAVNPTRPRFGRQYAETPAPQDRGHSAYFDDRWRQSSEGLDLHQALG